MTKNEKMERASARDIAATLLAIEDDGYIKEIDENVYQMTCPKCKAHTLEVNTYIQMCRCQCGLAGGIVDVIKAAHNMTAKEAADFLSKDFLDDSLLTSRHKDSIFEMHKDAANFYFRRLKKGDRDAKAAMKYLFETRGMSSETIVSAGLGYAGPKGTELYRYLKEKYTEDAIKESGLIAYSERGAYDFFRNRVMFPIIDTNNQVTGFGGRVMDGTKPKYLNSPETKIFAKSKTLYGMNKAFKSGKDHMLVCEGFMDTIALHSAGYLNSIASLGTALTEQHVFLIKKYAKLVYFLYDNDEPGIKAALRGIELANASGLEVKTVDLSPYKDPDEFIRQRGKEDFDKRLLEAIPSEAFVKRYGEKVNDKDYKQNNK